MYLAQNSHIYGIIVSFWQIICDLFYNYIGQSCNFCLQIVWQSSRRSKAVGVLGSPEINFVAHG